MARDAVPREPRLLELDAAALRDEPHRRDGERRRVGVRRDLEVEAAPDARHGDVVAPGLRQLREVHLPDVLAREVARARVLLAAAVRLPRGAGERHGVRGGVAHLEARRRREVQRALRHRAEPAPEPRELDRVRKVAGLVRLDRVRDARALVERQLRLRARTGRHRGRRDRDAHLVARLERGPQVEEDVVLHQHVEGPVLGLVQVDARAAADRPHRRGRAVQRDRIGGGIVARGRHEARAALEPDDAAADAPHAAQAGRRAHLVGGRRQLRLRERTGRAERERRIRSPARHQEVLHRRRAVRDHGVGRAVLHRRGQLDRDGDGAQRAALRGLGRGVARGERELVRLRDLAHGLWPHERRVGVGRVLVGEDAPGVRPVGGGRRGRTEHDADLRGRERRRLAQAVGAHRGGLRVVGGAGGRASRGGGTARGGRLRGRGGHGGEENQGKQEAVFHDRGPFVARRRLRGLG